MSDLQSWNGKKISHATLKLSGSKFGVEDLTSRDFEPDEDVYFVVKGHVDAKVTYEKTDGGLWQRVGSVTITHAYELDEATAKDLLEDGHAEVRATLARRGVRVEDSAA